ncbi:MAG: AraC family transcriptional regulator [Treponema sp.]|jgi:AraC-like DNA-binding protein|nr:AraC family transcriptional regulator [Treponema sp.]
MKYDFSALPFIRVLSQYPNRKYPLHILTSLSGHSRETESSYYNDEKNQDLPPYAVWQYTINGKGRLDGKGRSRDIPPGSLMILTIPGSQAYYLPGDSDLWEFVFMVLIGREAIRITRMIEQRLGNLIAAGLIPRTLEFLCETLQKFFQEEIKDPFINSSYTYRLCMLLLEETEDSSETGNRQSFERLKIFLRENIRRDILVEEMAEFMRLSRSHFTRIFSSAMGMSPRLYLEDLRLKTAADILLKEDVSVKEAACRCGIYDVNYFCRLFKKRHGISPGKYRLGAAGPLFPFHPVTE